MAEECSSQAVSTGYPRTINDIRIDLSEGAREDECYFACTSDYFSGTAHLYLDVGEKRTVGVSDDLNRVWTVKYEEMLSPYAAMVIVCCTVAEEDEEEEQTDDDRDVDYGRIRNDTEEIVEASESRVNTAVGDVGSAVAGVMAGVNDGFEDVSSLMSEGFSGITGTIGDLKSGLFSEIGSVISTVEDGIGGIGEQISNLEIPGIDDIKQCFLDVCGDLATALWDTILEEIEKRYEDQEEEED